jgi:hypothetical protein
MRCPDGFLAAVMPLVALAINALVQILSFKVIPQLGLLRSVISGFIVGLLGLIILIPCHGAWANLIIYLLLGYNYFHFINLGETARRVRIMRQLYVSPDGLSEDEILAGYNAKAMLEVRIRRLVLNGQIVAKDGRYFIGNFTVLLFAKIIIFLRKVVFNPSGEISGFNPLRRNPRWLL